MAQEKAAREEAAETAAGEERRRREVEVMPCARWLHVFCVLFISANKTPICCLTEQLGRLRAQQEQARDRVAERQARDARRQQEEIERQVPERVVVVTAEAVDLPSGLIAAVS